MNILAFDTSHAASSVALWCNGHIHAVHDACQQKQGTYLLPIISNLLKEANITLSDLNMIALSIGPGGFTGLRIGCSAAQAISLAHSIPIIPVSSLQLLAQTAYQEVGGSHFLVAVDAKKNQCYSGQYKLDKIRECVQLVGDETMVTATSIYHIDANMLHKESDAAHIVVVGNAWKYNLQDLSKHLNLYNEKITFVPDLTPKASLMFNFVRFEYDNKNVNAALLSPHYINDKPFSVPF